MTETRACRGEMSMREAKRVWARMPTLRRPSSQQRDLASRSSQIYLTATELATTSDHSNQLVTTSDPSNQESGVLSTISLEVLEGANKAVNYGNGYDGIVP